MSDTEVAEIEDMLNTSHMEDMEHLDILRPPHSHMSHRHEAAVHVSTFGSCKFIQRGVIVRKLSNYIVDNNIVK